MSGTLTGVRALLLGAEVIFCAAFLRAECTWNMHIEGEGSEKYAVVDRCLEGEYSGDVVIPSTWRINDCVYPVRKIDACAFEGSGALTSVVIPNSVTEIGYRVFGSCEALESVELPETIKELPDEVFRGCKNLRAFRFPSCITHIGYSAFDGCERLEEVVFPSSLRVIGCCAFSECHALQSIDVPTNIIEVGQYAFGYCRNLRTAKIPGSIRSVRDVFSDWTPLETVIIAEGTTNICEQMFAFLTQPMDVSLPNGLVSIGCSAFLHCENLTSINLPTTLKVIGEGAFLGCTHLCSIQIPEGVVRIPDYAFDWCQSLAKVCLPESLTDIGYSGFEGCVSLQSINFPQNLKSIAGDAFLFCSSLLEVDIPEGVTNIETCAFECDNLSSVTTPICFLGPFNSIFGGFGDGGKLSNVVVRGAAPILQDGMFQGMRSLQRVTLPDDILKIGQAVFSGCTNLQHVTLPCHLKEIGGDAFSECKQLREIDIPQGVTNIGMGAFYKCKSLVSVSIPNGVPLIDYDTFMDCSNLQSVYIPSSVRDIRYNAFYRCYGLQSYEVAEENLWFSSSNGLLFSHDGTDLISCPAGKSKVVIPDGTTKISDEAFYFCRELKSVLIPDSVTSIWCSWISWEDRQSPFYECDSLETIYVYAGDVDRVRDMLDLAGFDATSVEFKEVNKGEGPVLNGNVDFVVQGDSRSGYVIASQSGAVEVEVSMPTWMDPCSVLLEVTPDTSSVRANGARIRVVRGGMDITNYLDVPLSDSDGVIDFARATIKEEIVKEVLDPAKGAKIELDAADPKLTTAPTRKGLFYQLREGATLDGMKDGDSTVGDGQPWSPNITVKGGNSAFYSIGVGKGE